MTVVVTVVVTVSLCATSPLDLLGNTELSLTAAELSGP